MAMNEINYYDYRNFADNKNTNVFKWGREILILSPMGEVEEIAVEGYHFEALYQRFFGIPDIMEEDEFVTSCAGAKQGFVVGIVDYDNLSLFFPEILMEKQKNAILAILDQLCEDYELYAVKVPSSGRLCFFPFGNGEVMTVDTLKNELIKIPVILSSSVNNIRK